MSWLKKQNEEDYVWRRMEGKGYPDASKIGVRILQFFCVTGFCSRDRILVVVDFCIIGVSI